MTPLKGTWYHILLQFHLAVSILLVSITSVNSTFKLIQLFWLPTKEHWEFELHDISNNQCFIPHKTERIFLLDIPLYCLRRFLSFILQSS